MHTAANGCHRYKCKKIVPCFKDFQIFFLQENKTKYFLQIILMYFSKKLGIQC